MTGFAGIIFTVAVLFVQVYTLFYMNMLAERIGDIYLPEENPLPHGKEANDIPAPDDTTAVSHSGPLHGMKNLTAATLHCKKTGHKSSVDTGDIFFGEVQDTGDNENDMWEMRYIKIMENIENFGTDRRQEDIN